MSRLAGIGLVKIDDGPAQLVEFDCVDQGKKLNQASTLAKKSYFGFFERSSLGKAAKASFQDTVAIEMDNIHASYQGYDPNPIAMPNLKKVGIETALEALKSGVASQVSTVDHDSCVKCTIRDVEGKYLRKNLL